MFDCAPFSAVTVRALEPFFEWARVVADGVPVEPENWAAHSNIFLLPKAEKLGDLMDHVRRVYREIWEAEMSAAPLAAFSGAARRIRASRLITVIGVFRYSK